MWTQHTAALARKKRVVLLQSLHSKRELDKRRKEKGKEKEEEETVANDVDFRTLLRYSL